MFTEMSITMMFTMMILGVMAIGGAVIFVTCKVQDRPKCTRCGTHHPKANLVEFLTVPMCEPCENIAQYYNNQR